MSESVCCCFEIAFENNTSQVFKLMGGSDEMNSHREITDVVSDALFMFILSKP